VSALAAAETLPDALRAASAAEPDRVLLDCDGEELTVGALAIRAEGWSHALIAAGIEPGDRVAIMMRNVAEFPCAWLGILGAAAIEVPVHAAYRGPLLEHVLAESGTRMLICDEEFAPRLADLALPALERLVVRGRPAAAIGPRRAESVAEFLAGGAPVAPPPLTGATPTCILYTSGTTGRSKGVLLTHTANLRLSRTNVEMMRYGREDVLYTAFPLFHVNAKFTSLIAALLCGGRLVLDDRFSASGFWARMREKGVTAFNYMGSLLTILHKADPRADDADNPVTRCYGSACPAMIWEDFERRFDVRVNELYGMTEIGIATLNGYGERKVGSIGRAVDYFEVRVADDEDRECADGEVGEIQVRPREPGVMFDYYWERLDATAEGFRNLWFHTGDRGSRDADGFFHFADRSTDSVRRRGENVSSFEVESVLATHPAVLEAAAYGVPAEIGEEDLMVAVVLAPGRDATAAELLDHCQDRLPYFAVPRYVSFRTKIPKNASQRVQKFRLRDEGVTEDAYDAVAAGYEIRR
jgi:crotonobetaine/carnitine-CoA ligase